MNTTLTSSRGSFTVQAISSPPPLGDMKLWTGTPTWRVPDAPGRIYVPARPLTDAPDDAAAITTARLVGDAAHYLARDAETQPLLADVYVNSSYPRYRNIWGVQTNPPSQGASVAIELGVDATRKLADAAVAAHAAAVSGTPLTNLDALRGLEILLHETSHATGPRGVIASPVELKVEEAFAELRALDRLAPFVREQFGAEIGIAIRGTALTPFDSPDDSAFDPRGTVHDLPMQSMHSLVRRAANGDASMYSETVRRLADTTSPADRTTATLALAEQVTGAPISSDELLARLSSEGPDQWAPAHPVLDGGPTQ